MTNYSRDQTTLQGYDQIVALTQDTLNSSLQYLFKDPDAGYNQLDIVTDNGEIHGTLAPPLISLDVSQNAYSALFIMNIKSGKMQYWTGHNPQVEHDYTIKNWQLPFTVNLKLSPTNTIPDAIKQKIYAPGSYSIQQVLIDFSDANLLNFNDTQVVIPNLDPTDPTKEKSILKECMGNWLTIQQNTPTYINTSVLGYVIKANQKNVPQPTFPPTAVSLQTYAYKDNNLNITNAYGKNMFIFAETTQQRPLPELPLLWHGNLVTADMFGTMAVASHQFWDDWLFPQLNPLFQRLCITSTVSAKWAAWSWTLSINPNPGVSLTRVVGDYSTSPTIGKLNYSKNVTDKYKVSDIESYNIECDSSLDVSVNVGVGDSATITVQVDMKNHIWVGNPYTVDFYATLDNNFSTNFTITLNSVVDGKLGVSITPLSSTTPTDSRYLGTLFKLENVIDSSADDATNNIKTWVTGVVGGFSSFFTNVENSIVATHQYVLSGAGDFFFKNPKFNYEGDLLTELTYKSDA